MAKLLDVLPGVPVPVASMTEELARMWAVTADSGSRPPSEFRASQMNLVLHFGLATPPAEAREVFDTAIRFAQRYPCRILVLAPTPPHGSGRDKLEAKLYSQCFIGPSHREMCCCEALMLSYSVNEPEHHLENQLSVWLESDLPIYHWFHRVPAAVISARYLSLVKQHRRVVFDTSVSGNDLVSVAWPGARWRDLAWARSLPLRQSLGQILSGFSPERLVEKLSKVTVRHEDGCCGEGKALLNWQRECLEACFAQAGIPARKLEYVCEGMDVSSPLTLEIKWTYASRRSFRWAFRERTQSADLAADLGCGKLSYPTHVRLLEPEQALAEALFF